MREQLEAMYAIQQELLSRQQQDPLREFTPYPRQKEFAKSILEDGLRQAWFLGANRCLTPWTLVETVGGERLIEELIGEKDFYVESWDGESRCTRKASNVFLKSIEPAFRFHLDNGLFFEATGKHRVFHDGRWVSLESLLSMQGDRSLTGIAGGLKASYGKGSHLDGQLLHDLEGIFQASLQRSVDAHTRNPEVSGREGEEAQGLRYIHIYPERGLLANPDDPLLLSDLCALWRDRRYVDYGQSYFYSSGVVQQSGCGLDPALKARTEFQQEMISCEIPLFGEVKLIGYHSIGLHPIMDFEVEDTHCYFSNGVLHHNSGKSDIGAYVGAHLARFGNPDARPVNCGDGIEVTDRATSGWVVALDFPISRDVIQPKYFNNGFVPPGAHAPFIPEREIDGWKAVDQVLKLKNGSIVGFKSCDSGVKKFQGTGKDWVHFDEEPPKEIFDETVIRVEAGRALKIFGTCTLLPPPGQIGGVSWIFNDLIKPFKKGQLEACKLFGASIYDNPHIGREEIRFLETIYPEGSPQRRIRLEGEWLPGMGGARAYPSFDQSIHIREQDLNPRLPLIWCWDFNVAPLVTYVCQKHRDEHGQIFKVISEIFLEDGSLPDMCEAFKNRFPSHGNEIWLYGDATGKHRSPQSNMSNYSIILNYMRDYGVNLRMKVPETNPPVTDRINAMNRTCKDESGISRIEVDPSCVELIDDYEQVLLDRQGGIKKVNNMSDPYYRRTHMTDAVGYWVAYESPVRRERSGYKGRRVEVAQPGYGFACR